MSKSKLCKVSTQSSDSSNSNLITWKEVNSQAEADTAARKCVNEVLGTVETFVGGNFHETSACSITPLSPVEIVDREFSEDNRLVNWKRWIKIREEQCDKIQKSTFRRRPEMLLSLNPNESRKVFSRREILEKSAPGSANINFWKVPEKLRTDIYLTLPKSARVEHSEITYTQTPDLVLKEQHIPQATSQSVVLKLIQEKVDVGMKMYQPSLEELALKGSVVTNGLKNVDSKNSSRKKYSTRLTVSLEKLEPVERPRVLVISGLKIESSFPDVNVNVDLTFNGFKQQKQTKRIQLENRGAISLELALIKLPGITESAKNQHCFFFEKHATWIVPGETVEFIFHFCPIEEGVYFEKWKLIANPSFSSECEICFSLFGICSKKFKNNSSERKPAKIKLDKTLMEISANYEPNQASSSKKQFSQNNPKMQYRRKNFEDVNIILKALFNSFEGNMSDKVDVVNSQLLESCDKMVKILES